MVGEQLSIAARLRTIGSLAKSIEILVADQCDDQNYIDLADAIIEQARQAQTQWAHVQLRYDVQTTRQTESDPDAD